MLSVDPHTQGIMRLWYLIPALMILSSATLRHGAHMDGLKRAVYDVIPHTINVDEEMKRKKEIGYSGTLRKFRKWMKISMRKKIRNMFTSERTMLSLLFLKMC